MTTFFSSFLFLMSALMLPTASYATCKADAGSLGKAVVCTKDATAVISASSNDDFKIPDGFVRLFVLTSGDELVIEQVSPQSAFEVEASGLYTIHTLIYNPETLDLGIVKFGETTGFDVNSLLVQGGGDICASLDVSGIKFEFGNCQAQLCGAFAGTLKNVSQECRDNGRTRLTAEEVAAPMVPNGFSVLYVLTSGSDLVIEQVSDNPVFWADGKGRFTIHTLVYDPNTLDLGIVEFGKTTGFDVNGLLLQGGGDICGALDVPGAKFDVEKCECTVDFGKISPVSHECLEDDGSVMLEAEVVEDPTVIGGFVVLYVLTKGDELVIEAVNPQPEFEVSEPGKYRIHTLVYSPSILDLDIVEFGKTTGFDVNALLIQGGGELCGALDVEGAKFEVKSCNPACEAAAGSLKARHFSCFNGFNWVLLEAKIVAHPTVPAGFKVAYVVTTGEDLIIRALTSYPAIYVRGTGLVTIHTLVYDPKTLDLHDIKIDKTTGFDVNALLIQGGGDICAALDVKGAQFHVSACRYHFNTAPDNNLNQTKSTPLQGTASSWNQSGTNVLSNNNTLIGSINIGDLLDQENQLATPSIYPNPASKIIQIDIPTALGTNDILLQILSMEGQLMKTQIIQAGMNNISLDISDLVDGTYTVRFDYGNGKGKSVLMSKVGGE